MDSYLKALYDLLFWYAQKLEVVTNEQVEYIAREIKMIEGTQGVKQNARNRIYF